MSQNPPRIHWAPKVSQDKIGRLYQNDASGLADETLIEDLALGLYLRCQSILMVTERDRVPCPNCGEVIVSQEGSWSREHPIVCPKCGWQATFGQWRDSWRHKELCGGNAMDAYRAYVEGYERGGSAREKMLLIDRLINAYHWSLRRQRPHGPAAQQLIEGSRSEVYNFLERLAYGGKESGQVTGGREIFKQLESSAASRIGEIDRSEYVSVGYRQKAAELEAYAVAWSVPRWSEGDQGEHSVGQRVRDLARVLEQGGVMLGALDGEALVGYAVLRPDLHEGMAELKALFMSRPYRRKGIATRLLEEICRLARESGAKRLYVSATPSESAVGFYLSQGFAPTLEPDPELLAQEPEDIHMIREL